MTDAILAAVGDLTREGGSFASALAASGDVRTAIAEALETIDGGLERGTVADGGGTVRVEALLRARLADGLNAGTLPAGLDIDDLAAFFTGVVASLVVEALGGADPKTLAAIRNVALKLLPEAVRTAP